MIRKIDNKSLADALEAMGLPTFGGHLPDFDKQSRWTWSGPGWSFYLQKDLYESGNPWSSCLLLSNSDLEVQIKCINKNKELAIKEINKKVERLINCLNDFADIAKDETIKKSPKRRVRR